MPPDPPRKMLMLGLQLDFALATPLLTCCAFRAQIVRLFKNIYFYSVQIHKICRFINLLAIKAQVLFWWWLGVIQKPPHIYICHVPKCSFHADNPLKLWIIKKNYVTLTVCNYMYKTRHETHPLASSSFWYQGLFSHCHSKPIGAVSSRTPDWRSKHKCQRTTNFHTDPVFQPGSHIRRYLWAP